MSVYAFFGKRYSEEPYRDVQLPYTCMQVTYTCMAFHTAVCGVYVYVYVYVACTCML